MSKDNLTHHSQTAEAVTPERKEKRLGREPVANPCKPIADKIRKVSVERLTKLKTTLGLYSLKVKDGYFGVPFCAVNDHFALLAQKQLLPLADCYKVGEICLYNGVVKSCRPFVVLDNKIES